MRKIIGKVAPTAIAVAAVTALSAGSGAYAAHVIDSGDIQNHSIKAVDIKPGSISKKNLNKYVAAALAKHAKDGKDGRDGMDVDPATVNALQSQLSDLGGRVDSLEGQDGASAGTWEHPNGKADVTDANTVVLTVNDETPVGSSLENPTIDLAYKAGDKITFTYALADGAKADVGAPRVFVVIDGKYYTTMDNTGQTGYGTDNGDGTSTVDVVPVAANSPSGDQAPSGRVTYAGVVYDNIAAPGSVTITDLSIGGHKISFQ